PAPDPGRPDGRRAEVASGRGRKRRPRSEQLSNSCGGKALSSAFGAQLVDSCSDLAAVVAPRRSARRVGGGGGRGRRRPAGGDGGGAGWRGGVVPVGCNRGVAVAVLPGGADPVSAVRAREAADAPRWVWASTAQAYPPLLRAGVRVERCHDLELTEALLLGVEGRWGEPRSVAAAQA